MQTDTNSPIEIETDKTDTQADPEESSINQTQASQRQLQSPRLNAD